MSYSTKQAGTAFDRSRYPEDTLFFFDFDGVLATQCEEKVYRLPEEPMERRRLEDQADFAFIDHSLYPNTAYLRHLVFQQYACDTVPEPHTEAVAFARTLTAHADPYFIVTARSGYGAVSRMLDFAAQERLHPQEVFCLGRSSKAALLAALRLDWPTKRFVFFEDTQRHIDACVALGDPLLEIVKIEWPTCTLNAQALREDFLGPVR